MTYKYTVDAIMTGIQALLQEAVKAKQSVEEAEKKQKIAEKSLEQTESSRKGNMTSLFFIQILLIGQTSPL